jgi:Tol biopolymer transport system component
MQFRLLSSLLVVWALAACGGGGGGGSSTEAGNPNGTTPNTTPTNTVTTPPPTAASGSIVYEDNGRIYVVNVATGVVFDYLAMQYVEGGVSVSLDGTVAHLQEDFGTPGGVFVRLTRLDGSTVREFNIQKDLTNLNNNGGARISPDGKWVAFSINTDLGGNAGRADRTYVCSAIGTVLCTFWNFMREPGWTADNRLLAVNEARTQIFRSNANLSTSPDLNRLDPIGPDNLQQAYSPEGTPDNSGIVFSTGSIGLSRVFGLDIATGAVKQLFTGSVYQRLPLAVGSNLLFLQGCCANRNGGGTTAGILSSSVHRAPLNLNVTLDSPTGYVNEPGLYLQTASGRLKTTERYGYTPAVR